MILQCEISYIVKEDSVHGHGTWSGPKCTENHNKLLFGAALSVII